MKNLHNRVDRTVKFGPGALTAQIVAASLDSMGLTNKIPVNVRNQLVDIINTIESCSENLCAEETTTEYSLELNLGVAKLAWKKTIKKS